MDATTYARTADRLRLHEGSRKKLYRDSKGLWTIGVGRNLEAKGIRDDEEALMLRNDLAEAEEQLLRYFPWAERLDPVRYSAFVELMFNMGPGYPPRGGQHGKGLRSFVHTMKAAEEGRWEDVAVGLLNSQWARDVKATRAGRIVRMVRTGLWPDL